MSTNNHLNLNDIAELTGVSRSTVSRVVNNHPNVSEKTRQRVLAVIQEHNFQPNAVARALVSQRSKVIGIIVPHVINELFADPFFAMIIQAITTTANRIDYGVTLGLTSAADNTNTLERILSDPLLDGIIIAEASIKPSFLYTLHERGKRFVLVGRPPIDDLPIAYVDHENEKGGYLATRHLIDTGRQRIAFIPGRPTLTSSIDRQNGYERAMCESNRALIIGAPGNYMKDQAYQSMLGLIEQNVDAVFCASDMMSSGAMAAIKDSGLRIPEDIAIVGFDDAPIALTTTPQLTTIQQDIMLSGKVAAELLIRQIENTQDDPPQEKILPTNLIIRNSS